jgi:hypothetical protein
MPEPGPEAEELRREIQEIKRRIAYLEQRLELPAAHEPLAPAPASYQPVQVVLTEGASAVPVLGRALLGLAGAYVLRALTESGALPQQAGVFAAILYALGWLVWAARAPAGRRVEAALYSLTSALVLAPLLWEATIRFHAISTWTSAAVLLASTVFGLAISWRKNLLLVATIATLTGVIGAAALLLGSHDVIPFTFLLLAIAAAVEASACLEHWLSERWLTAAAADLSVLLATYLVTNARGLPEVYVPVSHSALLAAQMTLPVIYLSSTIVRTLLRGFTFTGFETAQVALALLFGVGGGLRLTGAGSPAMAAICLACAALCYLVSLGWLARRSGHGRNFQTYAAFGFLLAAAGSSILLSGPAAAALWSLLAVASLAAGSPTLRWHGCFYLLAGLFSSGALVKATRMLLGSPSDDGIAGPLVWTGAAAVLGYVLVLRQEAEAPVLRGVLAGAAFWLAGAISAALLVAAYHLVFGETASQAYCASLRTMVLTLGALLLAWAAARWRRAELKPLVYMVMCLAAYRLLFLDLRQDRKAALVLSLLFYGASLMILPRWIQTQRTPAG